VTARTPYNISKIAKRVIVEGADVKHVQHLMITILFKTSNQYTALYTPVWQTWTCYPKASTSHCCCCWKQAHIHTNVGFVGSRKEKRLLDLWTFRRLHFVHWITATGTDRSTLLFIRHSILVWESFWHRIATFCGFLLCRQQQTSLTLLSSSSLLLLLRNMCKRNIKSYVNARKTDVY